MTSNPDRVGFVDGDTLCTPMEHADSILIKRCSDQWGGGGAVYTHIFI